MTASDFWNTVKESDLIVVERVIHLASSQLGGYSPSPKNKHGAKRYSGTGPAELLCVLRAFAATLPASAEPRAMAEREKFRQLLLQMDREWPGMSWKKKLQNLKQKVHQNDPTFIRRSQRRETQEHSFQPSGPGDSSHSAPGTSTLDMSSIAYCPHHSQTFLHQYHSSSLHNTASTLLPTHNGESTDATLRPVSASINMSSILPDSGVREAILDHSLQSIAANVPLEPAEDEKAVKATRIMMVRAFYAWHGYAKAVKSRKTRLVTQWMVALRSWQTHTCTRYLRRWLQVTRQFQHYRNVRSAQTALHKLQMNVIRVQASIQEFQTRTLVHRTFLRWLHHAEHLYAKRRRIAVAESVVTRKRCRSLQTAAFRGHTGLTRTMAGTQIRKYITEESVEELATCTRGWMQYFDARHKFRKLSDVFSKWRVGCTSARYSNLAFKAVQRRHDSGIMSRFFDHWLQRTRDRAAYRQLIETSLWWHRQSSMKMVFSWWKRYWSLREVARVMSGRRRLAMIRWVWSSWTRHRRDQLEVKENAFSVAVKRPFRRWRTLTRRMKVLKETCRMYTEARDKRKRGRVFTLWKDMADRNKATVLFCARRQHHLLQDKWRKWRRACEIQQAIGTKIFTLETRLKCYVQEKYFCSWHLHWVLRKRIARYRWVLLVRVTGIWVQRFRIVRDDLPALADAFRNRQQQRAPASVFFFWRTAVQRRVQMGITFRHAKQRGSVFSAWRGYTQAMVSLRRRQHAFEHARRQKRCEMVFMVWSLVELSFRERVCHRMVAEAFIEWRVVYMNVVSRRWCRQKVLSKCWTVWQYTCWNRARDRLAVRLYHQRVYRLAFRRWVWKSWGELVPDVLQWVVQVGNVGSGIRLSVHAMFISHFVRVQIPRNLVAYQKLDTYSRILATTTVHAPLDGPISMPSTQNNPNLSPEAPTLHTLVQTRRKQYETAQSTHTIMVLNRYFTRWHAQWCRQTLHTHMLDTFTFVHRTRTVRMYTMHWRRAVYTVREQLDHADMIYAWNLLNRVCGAWKMRVLRRLEQSVVAGGVYRMGLVKGVWARWKGALEKQRQKRREKKAEGLAGCFYRRKMLERAFRGLWSLCRDKGVLLNKAVIQWDGHCLEQMFRVWRAKTLMRSVQRRTLEHGMTRWRVLRLRAWFKGWYRTSVHRGMLRRCRVHRDKTVLICGFQQWQKRVKRKRGYKRKIVAVKRLMRVILLARSWHTYTFETRTLQTLQTDFSRTTHQRYLIWAFTTWHQSTRIHTHQRVIQQRVLARMWRQWRWGVVSQSNTRQELFESVTKTRQRFWFGVWRLRYKTVRLERGLNMVVSEWRLRHLEWLFTVWKERWMRIEEGYQVAGHVEAIGVLRTAFRVWRRQWRCHVLDRVSRTVQDAMETRVKRRVWRVWIQKARQRQRQERQQDTVERIQKANHQETRKWVRKWIKATHRARFDTARKLVFAKTWADKKLLGKVLRAWRHIQ
ncbi:hypothetical protein SpCBS45565_g07167 [Spizellomyces sp. 'palustris']|nr:hypothetical protein SpCBS45565_g07167 [Spizellomyces sp. 'palustris']